MSEKKKLILSPDAFHVNENGEVVIVSEQVREALVNSSEEAAVGEQGVTVSVSVSI
ncbi:hypothetical protein [Brevibacillus daliensis]|uniref:hypothetical protein n=1 Tax=Brevibacillus daliensis TaxID=2892995 RepID=UPI001E582D84|nr:hypothetical protein [Brevibacillus daliensis]